MNHLIIFFAHPNSVRSFGRAIANRIEQISQENGVNVFFRDLYEMNFNQFYLMKNCRMLTKVLFQKIFSKSMILFFKQI